MTEAGAPKTFSDVLDLQKIHDRRMHHTRIRMLEDIQMSLVAEIVEFNEETPDTHKTWKLKEFSKEKELEELTDILFFFAQLVNRNRKSSIRVLEEEFNTEEKGYVNTFGLVEDVVFGAEYSFVRRYMMVAHKYGYTKEDVLRMYWKKWQKNMYERLGKEWA